MGDDAPSLLLRVARLPSESSEKMEVYEVSLDKYWSYIGIPYFFIVLAFGLYVLFSASYMQLAETPTMLKAVSFVRGSNAGTPRTPSGMPRFGL